jgi:mono/diheme cytochrome c family protein
MKRKLILLLLVTGSLAIGTGCNDDSKKTETTTTDNTASATPGGESTNPKGVGPHQNVELTHPLDEKMVAEGKSISEVKCTSCHKLTEERLVGPGWKGVTDRRTPEWIMNFITNTEEMINRDTAAMKMLEICLVKMPNQGLSTAEARSVLEYMRQIDGKK